MPRAFAEISFTPSVKAAQSRYGSRASNQGFEDDGDPRNRLTSKEANYLVERDSFYLASVGENGWPYVQHRGGPKGFLKVLDERTLGYADYRGNRQYLSVGNINANDKVSLILMDYRKRRRLKIWGRARIVHTDEAATLVASVADPDYPAHIERAVIITVEAIEWNCPQHIPVLYSQAEVDAMLNQ